MSARAEAGRGLARFLFRVARAPASLVTFTPTRAVVQRIWHPWAHRRHIAPFAWARWLHGDRAAGVRQLLVGVGRETGAWLLPEAIALHLAAFRIETADIALAALVARLASDVSAGITGGLRFIGRFRGRSDRVLLSSRRGGVTARFGHGLLGTRHDREEQDQNGWKFDPRDGHGDPFFGGNPRLRS